MKFLKTKFLYAAFTMLALASLSCEKEATSDTGALKSYIGLEPKKYVGLLADESTTVESKIYASEAVNFDRTFALTVNYTTDAAIAHLNTTLNSSYFTVPATVTIPAGQKVGTFEVGITGTNIGSGKELVLSVEELAGVNQGLVRPLFTEVAPTGDPLGSPIVSAYTYNKIIYHVDELCQPGFSKVVLSIKFDNYPEETAWDLRDSAGNVVASGGFNAAGDAITGYAALGFADASTFITNFCLSAGQYTFAIYDDYGDGMFTSTAVQGSYTVKLGGTTLASGGGDFGFFQETTFTIP